MTSLLDGPASAAPRPPDRGRQGRCAAGVTAAGGASEGALARLGRGSATHVRLVLAVWAVLIVGLGAFAPGVESSLSGAGWQANGSDSVKARDLIDTQFGGLSATALQVVVHSDTPIASSHPATAAVTAAEGLLRADHRVSTVVAPQSGLTISADGRTAVIQGGAGADSNAMVRAADDLTGPVERLSRPGLTVALTGDSALWSDFNKANLSAMLRSEVFSWPVTLIILVLAFGSLVAAGLPLMLTIAGLAASAGVLDLVGHVAHVSVWAMNFAMMFALALGIDYALFIVVRFRAALAAQPSDARDPVAAAAEAAGTAGKAVLFSGVTVLVSLSAVMLVPSPAFRSMALGIMIAVVFVLAATLTLLPAVLARVGARIDAVSLPLARPRAGASPRFGAWAARLWRRPAGYGLAAGAVLIALAVPVLGLRTGMPSITVIPSNASARVGYDATQAAFGAGAPNAMQVVVGTPDAVAAQAVLGTDPGVRAMLPARGDPQGWTLLPVIGADAPSTRAADATIERLRAKLPAGALLGGANVENHDLQHLLVSKTPLVVGVVLALGFLLLLVALQAPLVAAIGVLTNLLAVGAAFGVARLVFQDGHGAGLLGFTPQGFLDAWGPVFFFAMIFAISMDYTVFLLSTAKEHWDATGDPQAAVTGALAHTGRVIFAAAAVMVAVFFTFALSGPLPPKEMGIVLGVAVLLDALLVRLLLLPVLMRLAGKAAWACPAWLRRALPAISLGH